MSGILVRLYKSPAVLAGVLLLVAGLYFGADRDFGAWVISLFVLPALFLIAGLMALVAAIRRPDKRTALVALAIILATPVAWYVAGKVQDRVRFAVWAPVHFARLNRAVQRDGIVTAWDNWGLAGSGNDSYLVVDTKDRLLVRGAADDWTRRLGQPCKIVDTQRMWPRLYIVTTSDCPLQTVAPPR